MNIQTRTRVASLFLFWSITGVVFYRYLQYGIRTIIRITVIPKPNLNVYSRKLYLVIWKSNIYNILLRHFDTVRY